MVQSFWCELQQELVFCLRLEPDSLHSLLDPATEKLRGVGHCKERGGRGLRSVGLPRLPSKCAFMYGFSVAPDMPRVAGTGKAMSSLPLPPTPLCPYAPMPYPRPFPTPWYMV